MKKLLSLNVRTINEMIARLSSLPAEVRSLQWVGQANKLPTVTLNTATDKSDIEYTMVASFDNPQDYRNEFDMVLVETHHKVALYSAVPAQVIEGLCEKIAELQALLIQQETRFTLMQVAQAFAANLSDDVEPLPGATLH